MIGSVHRHSGESRNPFLGLLPFVRVPAHRRGMKHRLSFTRIRKWIPAFAGMTGVVNSERGSFQQPRLPYPDRIGPALTDITIMLYSIDEGPPGIPANARRRITRRRDALFPCSATGRRRPDRYGGQAGARVRLSNSPMRCRRMYSTPWKKRNGEEKPPPPSRSRFPGRRGVGDYRKPRRGRVSGDLHGEIQGGRLRSACLSKKIEKRNPNAPAGDADHRGQSQRVDGIYKKPKRCEVRREMSI